MTHADILLKWPSVSELARDVGKPRSTVNNWIARNRVPVDHWPRLIEAAAVRDISLTYGELAKAAQEGRAA